MAYCTYSPSRAEETATLLLSTSKNRTDSTLGVTHTSNSLSWYWIMTSNLKSDVFMTQDMIASFEFESIEGNYSQLSLQLWE